MAPPDVGYGRQGSRRREEAVVRTADFPGTPPPDVGSYGWEGEKAPPDVGGYGVAQANSPFSTDQSWPK
jgi:hypothetical protein